MQRSGCADQTSEATSLTGLVPERVQLTVHTREPTGTVPVSRFARVSGLRV